MRPLLLALVVLGGSACTTASSGLRLPPTPADWPDRSTHGVVRVGVREAHRPLPVAGVMVRLVRVGAVRDTATLLTGPAGTGVLSPLPEGTYQYTARRLGYEPRQGTVSVEAGRVLDLIVRLQQLSLRLERAISTSR